ncbi:MAG: DUF6171 family protein [Treponema sp.]|nr:DUF6171 family protein [Treponema sp.]
MTLPERPCPRCEREAGIVTPGTAAEIAAAVPLAPSLCADAAVYKARLARCSACAGLREGVLCAYCGCFVQFRARPKKAYCPNPAGNKWMVPGTKLT